MKSDICKLPCGEKDTDFLKNILYQTQKTGLFASLDKKENGRLRLLAEELVGMLPELLEFSDGEFWIDCNGKSFELHTVLNPNVSLTDEIREKLLQVSSSGKNAAAVGIMAKIKLAVEFMLIDYEKNINQLPLDYEFYHDGMGTVPYFSSASWSLGAYRAKTSGEKGEKWDELEKSIIANIADDVLVGIQGKKVEIIVKKAF